MSGWYRNLMEQDALYEGLAPPSYPSSARFLDNGRLDLSVSPEEAERSKKTMELIIKLAAELAAKGPCTPWVK